MSIRELKAKLKSSDQATVETTKFYIAGIAEGILAANAGAEASNKVGLFCQPARLVLNTDNLVQIMNEYLKKLYARETQEKVDDFEVATLLFNGLAATFPCTAKK
jgi:hypothetical protein